MRSQNVAELVFEKECWKMADKLRAIDNDHGKEHAGNFHLCLKADHIFANLLLNMSDRLRILLRENELWKNCVLTAVKVERDTLPKEKWSCNGLSKSLA
jgi:hypothetical protein